MPRIYATKGDAARRERFSIPVTARFLEELRAHATLRGLPCAEVARQFIERGLSDEKRKADRPGKAA